MIRTLSSLDCYFTTSGNNSNINLLVRIKNFSKFNVDKKTSKSHGYKI